MTKLERLRRSFFLLRPGSIAMVVGLQALVALPKVASADDICPPPSEFEGYVPECARYEYSSESGAFYCAEWIAVPDCYTPVCEIGDPDPCGRCGGDPDYGNSCSGS
jgi:hypothetical protein